MARLHHGLLVYMCPCSPTTPSVDQGYPGEATAWDFQGWIIKGTALHLSLLDNLFWSESASMSRGHSSSTLERPTWRGTEAFCPESAPHCPGIAAGRGFLQLQACRYLHSCCHHDGALERCPKPEVPTKPLPRTLEMLTIIGH